LLIAVVPVPNPNAEVLDLDCGIALDRATVRIYTPAMNLAAKVLTGPLPQGWNAVALPDSAQSLPNGAYFVVTQVWQGGRVASIRTKLFLLK